MKALVVFESMFGNTETIAHAVAEGMSSSMEVHLLEVGAAPSTIPREVALLVVGGPTHAFGMSRSSTRKDAAKRGDGVLVSKGDGMREWLGRASFAGKPCAAAAFDTSIEKPRWVRLAGTASRSAAKKLGLLGCQLVSPAESFWVADVKGPLVKGELDRAKYWGESLASHMSSSKRRQPA